MHTKPAWVADYVPSLDGLRGAAILLVLLDHCAPRLGALGLGTVARAGWIGVNLFFVLSGYLITGIILDGRQRPHFFRNFYARRGLRIWPVYALVVPLNALLLGRANTWEGAGAAWPYFLLFVQNLPHGLTGTLYPSWSVAIEEQFYLGWTPLARRLPAAALGTVLGGVLGAEPWLRHHFLGRLTAVNTLFHLDGLALGGLIALGLRATGWPRRGWGWAAGASLALGVPFLLGGGAFTDTGLAFSFGALVLGALLWDDGGPRATHAAARLMRLRPLRYLGMISYGLYMIHEPVFALLGGVDAYFDRIHGGVASASGDLAIVAVRWTVAMVAATALWYGFERPILRLKRYFVAA